MVWNQIFTIILFFYPDTLLYSFCLFQFLYIPRQQTAPVVSLHMESPLAQLCLHPSQRELPIV